MWTSKAAGRCLATCALWMIGLSIACTRPPPDAEDVVESSDEGVAVDLGKAVGDAFDINRACDLGERYCWQGKLWTCKNSGEGFKQANCPSYKPVCVVDKCLKCEPNGRRCAPPPANGGVSFTILGCDAEGKKERPVSNCTGDQVCFQGECVTCNPGAVGCEGTKARRCQDDGKAWQIVQDCAAKKLICVAGNCDTSCPVDHALDGHLGCEFWAVDLDQLTKTNGRAFDAQAAPFGVLVANPAAKATLIRVTADAVGAGGPKEKILQVQPGTSQAIELPPKEWGIGHQSIDGSGIFRRAFRLRTSAPVAAWQLNPISGTPLASADGSLLLPTAILGDAYRGVALPQQPASKDAAWRASITAVAVRAGDTAVTVFVKSNMAAGPDVQALANGAQPIFNLKQGDVLSLQTDAADGDISGMWVGATQDIALFASNEGVLAPATGNCVLGAGVKKECAGLFEGTAACDQHAECPRPCCVDHTEGQLLPWGLWDKHWVATRLARRGKEHDTWRIVTGQDQTIVSLKPQVGKMIPQMDAGQVYEFEADADFEVEANVPVQLVRITSGAWATVTTTESKCSKDADCKNKYGFSGVCTGAGNTKTCAPLGDPALLVEQPVSQYRKYYPLAIPSGYVERWVQITAPKTATVELDKVVVAGNKWQVIGKTKWKVARLSVSDGYHTVSGDEPVGVLVYGWGPAVGFAWPGGVAGPPAPTP